MELNYKTFGNGPALIILHGLFGSLDNWQGLAKRYAEHFSVYIVDQRNHGKSPQSDEPYTYQVLADDLRDFMEQQGIIHANLIGHSMGGKTVMQFAIDHEYMVEKLVVADMGIAPNSNRHTEIIDALRAFPFDQIFNRGEADDWLAQRIPDFGVRQFLLKSLDRRPDNGFEWKFNLAVLDRDYENILAGIQSPYAIDVPTLFIRGGKSDYVRDADMPEIQEIFPNVRFETIQGAGHWLHAEQPEAFFEKTMAFLMP
jgi:pimeloyl-ACP methyl ester carboxylesterase